MGNLKPLRPPQVQALVDLREAARSSKRIMLQAATGFGKTVVFCHMVAGARAKRKRVVFAVPSLSLVDQSFDRLVANGFDPADIGIMQADHSWRRPHAPIQVATAQTLARREKPECDLLVIDEAHEMHKAIIEWMNSPEMAGKMVVGLSATPGTKGLGKCFDRLVKTTPISELIEDGWLSKFKVFAPSHPDLSGIKTVGGDYQESQLGERMSKAQIVADVVDTWLAKARGLPTLCFAVNRAHAEALHNKFTAAGVKSAYVDMFTSGEDRVAIGERLGAGDIDVVVNIGTLTKGVDWIVRCLILARPTKSTVLFTQIIGRVLRPEYAPGFDLETREGRLAAMAASAKPAALILDHSDTHIRLGMVTDITFDELDDGTKKKASNSTDDEDRIPLPKECKECGGLVPALARECPCCGAVVRRPTNVQQQDGELTEFLPGSPRPKRVPVLQQLRDMGKASIIGQLYTLRDERGKSDGWVAANYRAIFDVWPRGLDGAPPQEPTHQLVSWIKARNIAYRKAMDAKRENGEVVL